MGIKALIPQSLYCGYFVEPAMNLYECEVSNWVNLYQCADFFAKFGAFSDVSFMTHVSPLEDVRDLLKNDAMKTFFLRE
jgi:hypothetical protein